ncbi:MULTISPECIES: type II toxin-antitoxin system RelB/DinJ family antitoxin [Levilactobacillus]|uniref:Type II toxin-antitoxin system RelB/DinJ family antitoxin n=1 Tax=Levilactobacillus tongjiangensis TaxID=2486023 RepID=A0ABW1SPH2_9LACO|nr:MULTISPECIES: type II toxin-antitoxin system RelB/DinJ family antitoxin [Levilactobacillus]
MQTKSHDKKRVQVNIDRDLVNQAEQIFTDIGLNTTAAVTAFYKQVVATEGLPFQLTRITPQEQLEKVIKKEIDSGNVKQLKSPAEISQWLAGDDEAK